MIMAQIVRIRYRSLLDFSGKTADPSRRCSSLVSKSRVGDADVASTRVGLGSGA